MSALVVASMADIEKYARGALSLAGALNTLPVPLQDVEAAIGLNPSQDLYLAGHEDIPAKFLKLLTKIRNHPSRVLGALGYGQNVIYLDPELPLYRRRFTHGHELGHKALEWHQGAYYLDDNHTLKSDTREELEQEANAFSAQVIFALDAFTNRADAKPVSLAVPLGLASTFGASGHATIRHYVAQSRRPMALLALGRYSQQYHGLPGLPIFGSQCVESRTFHERYGQVTDLFSAPVISLDAHPLFADTATATTGLDESQTELIVDTKRGRTVFIAQRATLRLNLVLLYPKPFIHRAPHVQIIHTR